MQALQHSPQVRAARALLETARVQADREKPVARPTVTAVAAGTAQGPRVTFPRPDGQPATVLPEAVGRLDLIVEQPLYRAGLRSARSRYLAQLSIGELEFRRAISDFALSVRKAHLDVLRADAGVRAAQDGVDAATSYQQLVEHQISAGQARPVDSRTAEAQTAEARDQLRRAEGGASLARLNYNRIVGRPLTAPVSLGLAPSVPEPPAAPDAAVAHALSARADILLLARSVEAARAGVSLARAQTQPSLNARGQVTEQTPSAFVHEHYYAATLELRWSLFDGGKARQDALEARSQADRLEAQLEDARQGVSVEVMQAIEKLREARARIDLSRTRESGLLETEKVAEKAYEVGRGTAIEVQSAQREVRTARANGVQALYDLQDAYADLLHAEGDLVDEATLASTLEARP